MRYLSCPDYQSNMTIKGMFLYRRMCLFLDPVVRCIVPLIFLFSCLVEYLRHVLASLCLGVSSYLDFLTVSCLYSLQLLSLFCHQITLCLHYSFLLHSPFTSHLLPLAKSEIYLFHAHLLWVNSTYNKTGPGENLRRRFLHFPFMTF